MSASHETSLVFKGSISPARLRKLAHGGAGRRGCDSRSLRMSWETLTSEFVNVLANFQGNPINQQTQHVRFHRYVSNHPPPSNSKPSAWIIPTSAAFNGLA